MTSPGPNPSRLGMVIGTGGFSRIFEPDGVFDELIPDLVHSGLYSALKMNVPIAESDFPKTRKRVVEVASTL